MSKLDLMKSLVVRSGGIVDDIFVSKHGIMLLSDESGITDEAHSLFDFVNISCQQADNLRLAEFTARLTYLSFPESQDYSPEEYHNKLHELGHTSPYNLKKVAFFIVGLSIEMVLEIVSGKANHSGRLTSSNTSAMSDTLYFVGDTAITPFLVRKYVKSFLKLRKTFTKGLPLMTRNQFNLGNKASAIVVSMTRVEWLTLIDSRLRSDSGCELEYVIILEKIKSLLLEEGSKI
jgi:hypothetical protein